MVIVGKEKEKQFFFKGNWIIGVHFLITSKGDLFSQLNGLSWIAHPTFGFPSIYPFAFGTPIEYSTRSSWSPSCSTRTRFFDIQFHQRQRQWDRYPQQLLQLLTLNQFESHYRYRYRLRQIKLDLTGSASIWVSISSFSWWPWGEEQVIQGLTDP